MIRTAYCAVCEDVTRLRRDNACAKCFERKRSATRYTVCVHCKKPKPATGSSVCSKTCRLARSKLQDRGGKHRMDYTVKILDLFAKLERCSTHWERDEIRAMIARYTERQMA